MYIYIILFGMHKPMRLLLNVNPMLIFVPCRFGYQFISIISSIFLIIYYLPNKLYIYIYIYIYICVCVFLA